MARVRPNQALKSLEVLYVEDEESIRVPFAKLLERAVKQLYVANDGEAGLAQFEQHPVDIVISDIQMPKLDGLKMVEKIKQLKPETLVVFTTAFSDTRYLQRSIEMGVDAYLNKPIDLNLVYETLNRLAERIVSKRMAEHYRHLMQVLLDEQPSFVALTNIDLQVELANKAFQERFKQYFPHLCDQTHCVQGVVHQSLKPVFQSFYLYPECQPYPIERLSQVKTPVSEVVCFEDEQANTHFYTLDIKRVEHYLLLSFSENTQIYKRQMQLQKEAVHDELTGLYNRKALKILEPDWFSPESPLYLILLDIDDFKYVNDTYGHLKGDEVLKALAQTLKHSLRQQDVVIRWGGEEFLVVLHQVKNLDQAVSVAEHLRHKIAEVTVEEVGHFSCSFGVVEGIVKNSEALNMLFDQADQQLYQAKQAGKNCVKAISLLNQN